MEALIKAESGAKRVVVFDHTLRTADDALREAELPLRRQHRQLRRLEAMMIVADKDVSLVLTGTGDVLEPEAGVMAIGSGGNYALAAARALIDTDKDAETIVRRSLDIAADICVYTNRNRHHRNAWTAGRPDAWPAPTPSAR